MALDRIGIGATPNDDTGDEDRTAWQKVNAIMNNLFDTITGGIGYFAGNVAIGSTSFTPSASLHVKNSAGGVSVNIDSNGATSSNLNWKKDDLFRWIMRSSSTAESGSDVGSDFELLSRDDAGGTLETVLEIIRADATTKMQGVYDNTTASAENVFVDTDGSLLRSTSSERFKDIIEPINPKYSKNIYQIAKEAVIFYKSLCKKDNPDWTHYGLSAEKLAEIDPRLVHLGYWPEDYETLTRDIEVEKVIKSKIPLIKDKIIKVTEQERYKSLKEDAELSPVGVQETKIIPLMLVEMGRMNDRMNDLENRLSQLE